MVATCAAISRVTPSAPFVTSVVAMAPSSRPNARTRDRQVNDYAKSPLPPRRPTGSMAALGSEAKMPEFRTIDAGAAQIRVAIEGQGPLVLMVHGFPESWYSWRHQIGPIAGAGFTAAAIDDRGYGGSGKPAATDALLLEQRSG